MPPTDPIDASFTLDPDALAQRRAANARRLYTLQIPALRFIGFVILCTMAWVQTWRSQAPLTPISLDWLIALNVVYAALAWGLLRFGYRRTGRLDLSLALFHVDLLVWLFNLYLFEQSHLFFAYFLLVRVVDQVGFGFRRALYFGHVVTLAYLVYSAWVAQHEPALAMWPERLGIAATMYLLGLYLSATGLVMERLRKRSRQAVRAAHHLVDRLAQKAAALQAQTLELEQARRQAETANRAKSQFLAVTSHEIRTPMNAILGSAELLMGTPLTQAQQQYVRTAHHSATALLALIDDVLDLSHIEGGKLTLNRSSVDLRALATEAVELVAVTARDKPLTLECEVAAAVPPRVWADPVRVRQLLVNLLNNAVKFTERGSVRLALQLLEPAGDALRVRFSVHDTGIGIAPDQLDSIFEAFTQADTSSTRRHGGSGLGLAIVKELVDLMGGQVGVESRPGEGSHFWIDLPLKPAPSAPASERRRVANADSTLVVLLADDDPVNQMVVEELLKRLGCEVEVVGDGVAAQRAASSGSHDIVFMDCHMPGMDGYEATRRIREDERRSDKRLPIVALTADALASDRERCLASGMDDFLTKPVSSAQLSAAIERWTGWHTQPATQW